MPHITIGKELQDILALRIKSTAFLRRCPRCDSFWTSRNDWLNDTKYNGMQFRLNSAAIWRVDIRAHDCGGEMLDEPTELDDLPAISRDAFLIEQDCTGTYIYTPHCSPRRGPMAK